MKFSAAILILLLGTNCTGISIQSTFSGYSSNPAKQYSNSSLVGMGGFAFHQNSTKGGIGQNANATKKGRACSQSYLYLVASGNSSIEAAKRNVGIQKVNAVEYENFAILGFVYHQFCTVVMGE